MAEVYIVINKKQLLAFTIAIKTFHHLDDNVWGFTDGWKVLLKSFSTSVVAKVNVPRGCVDLQVIATNTESPTHGPSVRQKKSSYFELHTEWFW